MKTTMLRSRTIVELYGVFVVTFVLAGPLTGKASANLVTNPGFESGLTGWTTNGFFAQGFDFGIDSQAHSGNNAFFGGAIGGLGFLTQTIPTVGGFFSMSLWLQSDGFLPNEFQVRVNNNVILDRTDILIAPYTQINLGFFPTSPTTTLSFGFRNDSGFLHLDDISVNLVPEPGNIALLGLGLVALAWKCRKVT